MVWYLLWRSWKIPAWLLISLSVILLFLFAPVTWFKKWYAEEKRLCAWNWHSYTRTKYLEPHRIPVTYCCRCDDEKPQHYL
jgi:hypothetical protein